MTTEYFFVAVGKPAIPGHLAGAVASVRSGDTASSVCFSPEKEQAAGGVAGFAAIWATPKGRKRGKYFFLTNEPGKLLKTKGCAIK